MKDISQAPIEGKERQKNKSNPVQIFLIAAFSKISADCVSLAEIPVKNQDMKTVRIDCFQCRHFYVTWDPDHPKGCRALAFKSKELPGTVVFRSSGMECLQFAKKTERNPSQPENENE
jgi:hypothetical protein